MICQDVQRPSELQNAVWHFTTCRLKVRLSVRLRWLSTSIAYGERYACQRTYDTRHKRSGELERALGDSSQSLSQQYMFDLGLGRLKWRVQAQWCSASNRNNIRLAGRCALCRSNPARLGLALHRTASTGVVSLLACGLE